MTDITNQKPLLVRNEGTAGPYVRLPFIQLDQATRLLDSTGVYYWVRERAISFDGGPEYVVINFGREGDAKAVQQVLDGVS